MEKVQVLIVEDDAIIAMDLESRMKKLGYGVTGIAGYGEQAIEKVKENIPDVVLMDIILKGEIDGIEAAEEIRTQYDIPVIFITGYADKERLKRAKLVYPFGFIIKPFQDKDLEVTIEMALYVAKADTERKQAEEALIKSETFLNATEKIAKVGGWEIDGETKKVFWTNEIYNITETPNDYDPSSLDKEAIVFFNAEDQIILENAIQRAFEHNEPYDMEFQITTAKGNKKWVQAICEPFVEDGKVVKIGGTFQDIAERKQAEEALRESEDKYRSLVESTEDSICLVDRNCAYLFMNEKYLSRVGLPADKIVGREYGAFHSAEETKEFTRRAKEVFETGKSIAYEYRSERDGKYFLRTLSPVKKPDGKITKFTVISKNITERKQAEEALRESEERFRTAFNNAATGMALMANDGYFMEVNQTLCRILGYSKEELLGKTWVEITNPDDLPSCYDWLKRVKAGEQSAHEKRFIHKLGHPVWIEMSSSLVRDSQGQIRYYISLFQDIMSRKQAEKQVKASLKEKEVLLREIHHRVKNNMQVIISLLKLQSSKVKDKQYADMLKESQNRIKSMSLIHEKFYQSKDFADIDFGEYVKSLVNVLIASHGVDTNKIRFNVDVKDVVFDLENAIPCGLIVHELVSNSLKHAFPDDREGEVKITLYPANEEELELTFSDDGIGIPEDLDFDNMETLGLDLTKDIVEHQLDGKIELDRTKGTTFHVLFKVEKYKVRI